MTRCCTLSRSFVLIVSSNSWLWKQYCRESTTVQSSVYQGYDSSRAVDGNRESIATHGSCFQTQSDPHPWWSVDLGSAVYISLVVFTTANGTHLLCTIAFYQNTFLISCIFPVVQLILSLIANRICYTFINNGQTWKDIEEDHTMLNKCTSEFYKMCNQI